MTDPLGAIQRSNAAFIEDMYRRFRDDPASVPESWAVFFAGFELGGARPAAAAGQASGGVYGLVLAYRENGHRIAKLDPLGRDPDHHPLLDLSNVGLSEADLDTATDGEPFRGTFDGTVRGLLAALRETYCGALGVEYMDIPDRARREWLEQRMEPDHNRPQLSRDERLAVLRQLLAADAFEQFLNVRYPGQKRFSLEGGAALIPMLETLVTWALDGGVQQIVLGMPHRGRLNALAHVLGKPLEQLLSEFESNFVPEHVQGHGDVKYHLGYSGVRDTARGSVHLDLIFNPSHLEFVNPVALGSLRARQELMADPQGARGIPVIVHGDAAFSGEGIVAETLMLSPLPDYATGGTLHVIVNNQVGFTTSPEDARLGRYPTDLARAVNAPVIHVNGDAPEAAVRAMRLAADYRAAFHTDVFVDLWCYRKHGHNELDDPTFTQPVMYRAIAGHVPASQRYAERLQAEGAIDEAGLAAMRAEIDQWLQSGHQRARSQAAPRRSAELGGAWKGLSWAGEDWSADTRVPEATLARILEALAKLPEDFHPHRKLARLGAERLEMLRGDHADWALGEVLAMGSLLLEGRHVRLSGQDTGRGTFSHRHAVLHDADNGRRWIPLQHLADDQGRFTVFDTPLAEAAPLGFEYGFTTADPGTLVIWEAQFGDFVNVAQVIVDQFLASGESKWQRMSGLVLLLPHGYEGQGPEHSSARLERFLELCADGNMQVINPTTPAQLFHALRRQLHRPFRKPLVVMSPKSLLRHRLAISARREFTDAGFQNAIDDAIARDAGAVRAVLLTSGRLYYALHQARLDQRHPNVAVVRLEQLYPFPEAELRAILARYPNARDVRWVQEEPANMGAWRAIRHRLEAVLPEGGTLRLVARKAAPTPASGWYSMHVEQERVLLERAFADPGGRPLPLTPVPADAAARGASRS